MNFMSQSQTSVDPAKLEKLAEVAVKVGLQLQKGQDLVMTAPSAALPLVRLITKHAYKAGAGLVTAFYSDEEATLARYRYGHDAELRPGLRLALRGHGEGLCQRCRAPGHRRRQPDAAVRAGSRPRSARANKANSIAYKPALEKISNFDINWNIVSYPNPSWAKQVFPDDPRGRSRSQARRRDLRRLARRCRRSDRGLGGAQCQPCASARPG